MVWPCVSFDAFCLWSCCNQQTRAKPGAALQTLLSLADSFSDPLVRISLRRRHSQTVKNGASSHKTNYITIFSEILNLNLKGHLNHFIGSKVTAIFLNGWILATVGAASGRVFPAACAAGLFPNKSHSPVHLPFVFCRQGKCPFLIIRRAVSSMPLY